MPIKLIIFCVIAICMSSCSSAPTKNEATKKDLIQQYDAFYKATIGTVFDAEKIKKWMTFDSEFGKSKIKGVNGYNRYWCSSFDVTEMKRRTTNIAIDYCYGLGGKFHDRWCRSPDDKPLFYLAAGDMRFFGPTTIEEYCHPDHIFGLVVSTSEGATPEDWNYRSTYIYHYAPLSEFLKEEKQEKQKRESEFINRRLQAESYGTMILSRGVGRRVCKDSGIWSYSGIVNKIENDRIQVHVDIKSAGGVRDRNFTSTIAVDTANKWIPCDTVDELNLHR